MPASPFTTAAFLGSLLTVFATVVFATEINSTGVMPLGQSSFAAYQADTKAWVEAHRRYVSQTTQARALELDANLPKEIRPEKPDGRGILLVHGLGDSPWSFSDIAASLAQEGILVRTVLLPGCGTQPADMMTATAGDWQRVVQEQADCLAEEVDAMWLGGYSTGGNLVLDYAQKHPEKTQGLVLFSPAVEVRPPFAWLAPAVSHVKDWLVTPESRPNGGQTPFQYFVVPIKGLAAFYHTMTRADDVLSTFEKTPWNGPSIVMLAEHDGLVETEDLLPRFDKALSHPRTRLVWYGDKKNAKGLSDRVKVFAENVPEAKVTSFSHMAMTYRPDNPAYGLKGSVRICWNGQSKADSEACERGEPVWFSGERHQPDERNHARLTFNPWYDEQLALILSVMGPD